MRSINNFFILYKAELRKILSKRSVWVSMAISLVLVLLTGLTNLSADGHSAYVKEQEELLTAVSGSALDDEFLDSFIGEIDREIDEHPERYAALSQYDPLAAYQNAAGNIGKSDLYDLLYNVVRDREKIGDLTADGFYEAMRADIIQDGRDLGASDEELDTWLEIYDGTERPMVYSYALAYSNILDVLFIIGWALILNISIALAGVFADEKTYRTDSMILSSRNGRLPVCSAKLAAGVTAAVMQCLVLLGLCMGMMFFIYGSTGWDAAIQNVIPSSPWNITVGNMVLIYIALAVLVSILFAVTNILLSLLTKSAVATVSVHAAFIFAGLFNVPGRLGTIAKLWQLRPTMALYYGTFCNMFRYGNMSNVGASVLIYTVMIIISAAAVLISYRNAQVESR